jgi:hypothetical protein
MDKSDKINWAMFGIFALIIMAQWQVNQEWLRDAMDSQEDKLSELEGRIGELTGRLDIMSVYLAQQGLPPIYGQPQENGTNSNEINISIPTNGSSVDEMFSIEGMANVSDLDNIYVISQVKDKYWILTDGVWDSTGKWKGVKSCMIPIINKSECETFEVFAIISNNTLGIGDIHDEIPDHLAKSRSIYVKRCSS